jgi:hypothetical protein
MFYSCIIVIGAWVKNGSFGFAKGRLVCRAKPNVPFVRLTFYTQAHRLAALRRRVFSVLNFTSCTKLEFSSSLSQKHETPAFAKWLIPPVLTCLSWFVGLFVAVIIIVRLVRGGAFLKISFSLGLAL